MRSAATTIATFAVMAIALAGCERPPNGYQGWVEANLVFVGPDEGGRLETLSITDGETVAKGAPLFTLEDEIQEAERKQAEAALVNAQQAHERARQLVKTAAGTQRALDDAEAALRTAQARLSAAQTRLVRRKIKSPVDGTVQQIYYRAGEIVPEGRAVLALLPPGNIKVRFFVPEAVLPRIALGDRIEVGCDGCGSELSARVSFIARSAEYTPPVIYSLEERSKLVFMIEALPERPERLRVGQPVSVRLAPTLVSEERR